MHLIIQRVVIQQKRSEALSVSWKGYYLSVNDTQETASLINIRPSVLNVRDRGTYMYVYRPYPSYIMSLFTIINIHGTRRKVWKVRVRERTWAVIITFWTHRQLLRFVQSLLPFWQTNLHALFARYVVKWKYEKIARNKGWKILKIALSILCSVNGFSSSLSIACGYVCCIRICR